MSLSSSLVLSYRFQRAYFLRFLPLIVAAASITPALVRAQAVEPEHAPFVLRVNARLVVLDVVVTDKAGKPVDGLSASDFKVLEDGVPQTIRSVEPPALHALPPATAAAGASAVFDPAKPAAFGNSPVTILVLDQLNTHFADSSFARRSLHDYLTSQPALLSQPATLLAVYDDHFKMLQTFTRDRNALLHALEAAPVKYPWKLEVNGKTEYGPVERLDQSLRALEEIAQSYARISGRKNLIWVGGGFPTLDPATLADQDAREVKDALQHVSDVLLDAHVTLYAVDPASQAAGMTEVTDTTQMDFLEAAGDGLASNFDPFGASDDFDRLAPATGGRIVRGKNDIARQIDDSIHLSARFYTISYSPSSDSEAAVQFRKIAVVCSRPGLTATTRSGYYTGQAAQERTPGVAAYDLTTAAETSLPLNGIRVEVKPEASPDTYLVRAAAANLTWETRDDGSATASVYVMAVSLDAKGKMLSHTLHGMTATARPRANLNDPAKLADFRMAVQPSSKAATLRFIVRDNATGRMGSFDLPLHKRYGSGPKR